MRVACYQRIGRSAQAVQLRLVPYAGEGGPVYLDPPAPADAWNPALADRVHLGIFRVCSASAAPGGGDFTLCAADDARRLLQRRDAAVSAGWTGAFPAAMLTAATARDAPKSIQGFAVRATLRSVAISAQLLKCIPRSPQGRPLRRIAAGLLLEGLGAFAAATVEVTVASAKWLAECRPWWARALSRGIAVAVLLAATEYTLTVIVPISVERLPRGVFVKGGAALTLALAAFALWGLIVQAAASALGSAFVVWLCALVISHVIMWPALLLLSAGLWRDAPLLPNESTGPAIAPSIAQIDAAVAKPSRRWGGKAGDANGRDVAMTSVAVMQPPPLTSAHDDNPFAGPPAQSWSAPRAPQHGAW